MALSAQEEAVLRSMESQLADSLLVLPEFPPGRLGRFWENHVFLIAGVGVATFWSGVSILAYRLVEWL